MVAAALFPTLAAAFHYQEVRRLDLALRMLDELEARSPPPGPDRPSRRRRAAPYTSPEGYREARERKERIERNAVAMGTTIAHESAIEKELAKVDKEIKEKYAHLEELVKMDEWNDIFPNAQIDGRPNRR